ncbi:MAG: AIR synthase family protein [Candidatus Bathyarchaeia archaeon]
MPQNRRLRTGKIPNDVLKRCVLNRLGSRSDRVIRGAAIGEDAPIIDMGTKVLVAKANPITGAEENIGRLAVHVNANDVAARGAKPLWFMNTILLPEGCTESKLEDIMDEVNRACIELGVQLIGGHTECVAGLERPIVAGFMMGEAPKNRYVTTSGAKPGDRILLTKTAGLEGTSILASDLEEKLKRKVDQKTLQRARRMIDEISVVSEALMAVETGGVHSMHTPTEGGVLNGLYEMGAAAGVGLSVEENLIPIAPETRIISEILGVDPLKLLSSGSLLMSVNESSIGRILDALESIRVKVTIIGEVKERQEGRVITRSDGTQKTIASVRQDELFRVLGEG